MILITEFMDEAAVKSLANTFETIYDPDLADRQDDIPSKLANVEALIVRNRTKVTKELLSTAPNLKCVGRLGVGLDNIDQVACAERGVTVFPAIGANNLSVAEYVISSAMTLLRGAYTSTNEVLAGGWPRQACAGREISGKTLGLIGFGAIAQHTATLARALGMDICAYDPFLPSDHNAWEGAQSLDLEALLVKSDVISLHTPLTPDTHHLINADRLSHMKTDAILINAARGGVVDESALSNALRDGKLGGAAFDVFETEPVTLESGTIFKDVPNLLLTPHIAGVTAESNVRVSSLIAKTVANHLAAPE